MNPNDIIRDAILRELYEIHRTARGARGIAVGIMELRKLMKEKHGYSQNEVISNLDYLVQKGWVTRIEERRTFTTLKGTVQPEPKITYKISDIGIDRLESASAYQHRDLAQRINITNIHGVTVVGNENVVNTSFTDLSRVLTELRQAVLGSNGLDEAAKLDTVSDIDSLQSQLQKQQPNKGIIKSLWGGIEKAVTATEFAELVGKAGTLLGQLVS